MRELRALEQIATRETVAELTGLKLTIVDDRLRALVEEYPETRNISKTILASGYVMLEITGRKGVEDMVIHLTPTEDRKLAELSVGAAGQAILINSTNQHLYLATKLAAKVEMLERELKAHKANKTNAAQGSLID